MLGLKENRPEARQTQLQISNLALPIYSVLANYLLFSSPFLEGDNDMHGVVK